MARTKGAKDARPRKKALPRGTGGRFQKRTPIEASPMETTAVERPPLPNDDFQAAIAAELGHAPNALPEPGPVAETPQVSPQGPAPAGGFDPNALTIEGLTGAWQVPFWALGHLLRMLRIIPSADPIIAVGKRRAKDLARPSYTIYEHYTRQYLNLNPENEVHVAAGVTGLNLAAIVPELVEAVLDARRRSAASPAGQGGPPASSGVT
jgi:hypothetical protein